MAKKPKQSTALTNWEQEMEAQAQLAVQSEATAATGGGKFFSLRSGILSFDDAPLPGNQMAVVVLDSMMENVYYEGAFDPDQKSPPTCFGFGRDAHTIAVHEEVFKHDEFSPQCGPEGGQPENPEYLCGECPMNQWGTARTGKGKACSNRRRLALIPAGTYRSVGRGGGYELELFDEEQPFREADVAFMKVPVMSVKGFASYLQQTADQFRRPLHGVFTRIYVEPDPKSQFRVKFELIDTIPGELIPTIMKRHEEAKKAIDFPYIPMAEDDAPAKGPQKMARGGAKLRGGTKKR